MSIPQGETVLTELGADDRIHLLLVAFGDRLPLYLSANDVLRGNEGREDKASYTACFHIDASFISFRRNLYGECFGNSSCLLKVSFIVDLRVGAYIQVLFVSVGIDGFNGICTRSVLQSITRSKVVCVAF